MSLGSDYQGIPKSGYLEGRISVEYQSINNIDVPKGMSFMDFQRIFIPPLTAGIRTCCYFSRGTDNFETTIKTQPVFLAR